MTALWTLLNWDRKTVIYTMNTFFCDNPVTECARSLISLDPYPLTLQVTEQEGLEINNRQLYCLLPHEGLVT